MQGQAMEWTVSHKEAEMELEPTAKKSKRKTSPIVFGVLAAIAIAFIIYVLSTPESGVKMANEMDRYALEYIVLYWCIYV